MCLPPLIMVTYLNPAISNNSLGIDTPLRPISQKHSHFLSHFDTRICIDVQLARGVVGIFMGRENPDFRGPLPGPLYNILKSHHFKVEKEARQKKTRISQSYEYESTMHKIYDKSSRFINFGVPATLSIISSDVKWIIYTCCTLISIESAPKVFLRHSCSQSDLY